MRIDFENHFYTAEFLELLKKRTEIPYMEPDTMTIHHGGAGTLAIGGIIPELLDLTEKRIRDFDDNSLDIAVVSSSLGIEQLEKGLDSRVAGETNDALYRAVCKCPDRLRGFSILAVKDISVSVRELERCGRELGFVGWNAFSNYDGNMLDDPIFFPLLKKAAELDMIVYIHPGFPNIPQLHDYGVAMASAGFGFAMDVSTCVLRMIFAGVFDRLPELKVIIGHLGEGIPFSLDRLDNNVMRSNKGSKEAVNKELPSYYFKKNIWVSTSGNFSVAAFRCAKDVLGIDRIVLGSDYPMEPLAKTMDFISSLELSRADREKLLGVNALRDFGMVR